MTSNVIENATSIQHYQQSFVSQYYSVFEIILEAISLHIFSVPVFTGTNCGCGVSALSLFPHPLSRKQEIATAGKSNKFFFPIFISILKSKYSPQLIIRGGHFAV
ncbi:hypothetical protein L2744_06415 [Shewanella profunda]|uniref:hypothetical protein n=1 Tax=Shewanella profunda TaxID=254793 RepID=UPI00200E42C4|nr:hypothetical protein [Shewanella profunda]MCL1089248.1 hypothetical protein [Shewanella profunda]